MGRHRSWVDTSRQPGRRAFGMEEDIREMARAGEAPKEAVNIEIFVLEFQTWDAIREVFIPSPRAAPMEVVGERAAVQAAMAAVDDPTSGVHRVVILHNGAPKAVVEPDP